MYPAYPLSTNDKKVHADAPRPASHSRPSFSRASHYALVLMAPVIGVAYALLRYTDGSLFFRFEVFSMFLFGLGAGVFLLHAVGLVEDWEENHFE